MNEYNANKLPTQYNFLLQVALVEFITKMEKAFIFDRFYEYPWI